MKPTAGPTKRLGAVLLMLTLLGAAALSAQTKTGEVVFGTRYVFKSESLAGDIPLRIHLPADYDDGKNAYPVLYMLEIANDFNFASTSADFLAACGRIPGLIVVSVDVDKITGPPAGLIAFLEKDLIPYVERTFRTQPRRLLYGHSGRSFAALFILINRPGMFADFILPGVGLTWPVEAGRLDFAAKMSGLLDKLPSFPKTMVLSLGDEKKFFSGVEHFLSVLRRKAPKDFRWTYLQYPDDDHLSTKLKTLYQGLEFIFKPGPAGDPSGEWTGEADIRTEDGSSNRLALRASLKTEGTVVTGTIGPSPDTQFAISRGERSGAEIVIEAPMPTRLYHMRLTFGWNGELAGPIDSADGKVSGTMRLRRVR